MDCFIKAFRPQEVPPWPRGSRGYTTQKFSSRTREATNKRQYKTWAIYVCQRYIKYVAVPAFWIICGDQPSPYLHPGCLGGCFVAYTTKHTFFISILVDCKDVICPAPDMISKWTKDMWLELWFYLSRISLLSSSNPDRLLPPSFLFIPGMTYRRMVFFVLCSTLRRLNFHEL